MNENQVLELTKAVLCSSGISQSDASSQVEASKGGMIMSTSQRLCVRGGETAYSCA